jgi:hypothetical protein
VLKYFIWCYKNYSDLQMKNIQLEPENACLGSARSRAG